MESLKPVCGNFFIFWKSLIYKTPVKFLKLLLI